MTMIPKQKTVRRWSMRLVLAAVVGVAATMVASAQGQTKWLAVGSLQNWYSEKGWEVEEGFVREQQYGLRWPAQYNYEDMQAAKAMWVGVTNYTDAANNSWPFKVVHVGPRVAGDGEFFPVSFTLYSRFAAPAVYVDGLPTLAETYSEPDVVDPSLISDRMLETIANTDIGVKVDRKIYQFSQAYHDNYHVFDITYTNTNVSQTLTGLYVFFQWRYSVCAEVRYCVNNSSGWGINTMNDARGPWYPTSTPTDLRAQFSWHGFHDSANKPAPGTYPGAAGYDNIGGPIWNPSASAGYVDASDSTWRLGAAQFVGNVTLHADKSPTDTSDDMTQPSTTNYVGSDDDLYTRNNSEYNLGQMTQEYAKMSEGHKTRHAWLVQPDGKFDQQTSMANIGIGSPGGWSSANGYGPYTLAPGQSVRIVFAEGADGLTRDECIRIGKQFRDGVISDVQKNDSVFIGRDRLFNTFRRALANYNSGYKIPQPLQPPPQFNVNGGGDKIALSWSASPDAGSPDFVGYRLYRARGRSDSTYSLLAQTTSTSYDDVTAIRGVDYYYYVTTVSNPSQNVGGGLTPVGQLESSRFYTQTFTATNLKRPAPPADSIDLKLRIVPNPFAIQAADKGVNYRGNRGNPDAIGFIGIPGNCTIRIYTELGELIKQIEHSNGTGDEYWNSITSSDQVIVSGIYIVVVDDHSNGKRYIRKLVVVR